MVWSFTFINGFESINHGFATALGLNSLCSAASGLEDKGEYLGSWQWKGIRDFLLFILASCTEKTLLDRKLLCARQWLIVLYWELFFRKNQLHSWMLNYRSLFAQCPFSGAGLETSLEESILLFFASLRAVSSELWRKRVSVVRFKQRFTQCRRYDWILWYSMHGPNKRNFVFEASVGGSRKNLVMEPRSCRTQESGAREKLSLNQGIVVKI